MIRDKAIPDPIKTEPAGSRPWQRVFRSRLSRNRQVLILRSTSPLVLIRWSIGPDPTAVSKLNMCVTLAWATPVDASWPVAIDERCMYVHSRRVGFQLEYT